MCGSLYFTEVVREGSRKYAVVEPFGNSVQVSRTHSKLPSSPNSKFIFGCAWSTSVHWDSVEGLPLTSASATSSPIPAAAATGPLRLRLHPRQQKTTQDPYCLPALVYNVYTYKCNKVNTLTWFHAITVYLLSFCLFYTTADMFSSLTVAGEEERNR